MSARTIRPAFDIPNVNLAKFQIDEMSKYGDAVAMVDAKTKLQYTYRQVIDRIYRLAAGLEALGLRQGDVMCALTFNTLEYPIIWYAVNMVGATFQTASPLYTDDELERRFGECNTKFLVTIPSLTKRVNSLIYNIKLRSVSFTKPSLLNKLIVIGEATEGFIPYDSLYAYGKLTTPAKIDPSKAVSLLLSSSGTSGLPKFVKLSHVNIIVNVLQIRESLQIRTNDVTILALPSFHHFGLHTAFGTNLNSGMKVVVMERWHAYEFMELAHVYRASVLQIVPAMAASLIKHPERKMFDLSSVRIVMTAAAPMGPGIEKHLKELFNIDFVSQAYGLTETGFNSGNKVGHNKPGACGTTPSGVDLLIVDPDTREVLPRNKVGEIVVGGPMICLGYLNQPEAEKISFDENGYFKTGDLAYFDSDGCLFIVDRLKELIKYKGLQVAPAYIEDILHKHPGIADVAVIGVPDETAGELPKAFVVRQDGSNITANEVTKYVEDHVSPYMRLRGGVEFTDVIPRNPSGKILRRFLRDGKKSVCKL